jgi:hypothetical protein
MKIYLTVVYRQKDGNVWADIQAFTSESERDKHYGTISADEDKECQDLTVTKRTYVKNVALGVDGDNSGSTL